MRENGFLITRRRSKLTLSFSKCVHSNWDGKVAEWMMKFLEINEKSKTERPKTIRANATTHHDVWESNFYLVNVQGAFISFVCKSRTVRARAHTTHSYTFWFNSVSVYLQFTFRLILLVCCLYQKQNKLQSDWAQCASTKPNGDETRQRVWTHTKRMKKKSKISIAELNEEN